MPVKTQSYCRADLSDADCRDRSEVEEWRRFQPLIDLCLSLNHDMNNLLAGIIGNVEYLLTDEVAPTPSQIPCLNQIQDCANRLAALVAQVSAIKKTLPRDENGNLVRLAASDETATKAGD